MHLSVLQGRPSPNTLDVPWKQPKGRGETRRLRLRSPVSVTDRSTDRDGAAGALKATPLV